MPDIVADVFLRLMGAFYGIACLATIRAAAMSRFLDQALGAITKVDPQVSAAETWRSRYLIANAFLVGIGGVLLAARLDLAAAVFVIEAVAYGVYLFILSPRLFDPHDPPEEPGRSQTWNAFWIYLGATAIVLAAWWSGFLQPARAQPWPVLAICGAVVAALVGFALHQFRPWQKFGSLDEPDYPQDVESDGPDRVLVTPSWYGAGLRDADTGHEIFWLPEKYLPQEEAEAIANWTQTFHLLADPGDPMRCRLKGADAVAKLETEGRPIYERLVERMGADRVSFEPTPRPCPSQVDTPAVKVMAELACDPLWFADGDEAGCFAPDHFGVSVNLANDLNAWEDKFDRSYDRDDPRRERWTQSDAEEHEREGRVLACRLADELAATGRGHVAVYYQPTGGELETIRQRQATQTAQ